MMTRALAFLLVAAAATASAQGTKTPQTKTAAPGAAKSSAPPGMPPMRTAAKAADTKSTAAKAADTKAADTKTPAPPAGTKTAPATPAAPAGTKTAQGTKAPGQQPGLTVAPEPQGRPRAPVIMREVFDYDAEGRRDPFFSLLTSAELRPTVADLRLVGITYDPTGRRSIATLREAGTNTRYQVTTGTTLGRMRVVLIKPKAVFFSIEEFGLNRQDSLVLGDTTKARAR